MIAAAVVSVDEACAALAELRARAIEGVEPVTAVELAEAEHAVDLAQLHAEGAGSRAAQDAERARVQRVGVLRRQLIDLAAGTDLFDDFAAAVDALTTLTATIVDRNTRVAELVDELADLGPLPNGDVVARAGTGAATVKGITIEALPVARLLAEASWRAGRAAGSAVAAAAELARAAGVSGDRDSAVLYGVGFRPDGAPNDHGLTDRLRWLAGQLKALPT